MSIRTRPSSEHEAQAAVIKWRHLAMWQYPDLAGLHAIPNGGDRDKAVAARMKAEGVVAGMPDLHLPVARGEFIGLWIEMKRADKRPKRGGMGGVSREQKGMITFLRSKKHMVKVCYGSVDAIAAIIDYLNLE